MDHNPLSLTLPQPHHWGDPRGSGARESIPPQAEGDSATLGSLFSLSGPLCAMETSDPALKSCCEWGRRSGHSRINHYPGIFSKAIKAPRPFPRPSEWGGDPRGPAGHDYHLPHSAAALSCWARPGRPLRGTFDGCSFSCTRKLRAALCPQLLPLNILGKEGSLSCVRVG